MTVNKLSDRESEYHKMVDGTVSDYNSVNRKLQLFRQELACKTQECFEQQEQITRLLAQLVDAQREKKELQVHLDELHGKPSKMKSFLRILRMGHEPV